jgi:hypothetical protein
MEISFLAGSTPDRDKRYTFPETRLLPFEPAFAEDAVAGLWTPFV